MIPSILAALLLSCVLCSPGLVFAATDIISSDEALSGNQTLISQQGIFEMGFFTPGTSGKHYIGIWYKGLPSMTVVWVANRQQPVSNPFLSQFKILQDGSLVILDSLNNTIWSADYIRGVSNYTHGVLLDSGNFVIRGNQISDVVWQSFDHPTDTWLPGAKFGYSKRSNDTAKLVAWRHPDDPAPGSFSFVYVCNNGKMHSELRNASKVYWDSREWTGEYFNKQAVSSIVMNFSSVLNDKECYLQYSVSAPFSITREVIESTGQYHTMMWLKRLNSWKSVWQQPAPECEIVAFCGVLGSCNRSNVPICASHSQVPFCSGKMDDKFVVMPHIRAIPRYYDYFRTDNIDLCRMLCLTNCSCAAFVYEEVCYLWVVGKFKVQLMGDHDMPGKDLYIRTSNSLHKGIETKNKDSKFIALGCSLIGLVILGLIVAVILRRRDTRVSTSIMVDDNPFITVFKHQHLSKYTKKFTTKIGEGGFGVVFKGNLPGSNAIAVKRLKSVNPSEKQFLAEVKTIGLIHHINLVRLCGFCINGSNKFLVYDYMPNGSLASHLFQNDSIPLSWEARYKIAIGIARGLAYLHEECRECIIHCDIKPENVLLDSDMVPKIADFGLAKLVGRDFSRVLTTVRGTRGYLAPEWISGEAITSKVDVFSYGKLLFEIISGKRNIDMASDDMLCYFPIRVFDEIHKGGKDLLTLLDYGMEDAAQLERACRVACWCIQDSEKDRPNMSQVVQMLEGDAEVANNHRVPRFYQQLLKHN